MKNLTLIATLTLAALVVPPTATLYAASGEMGTVQVTVLGENGQVVSEAPIYIYGEGKTRFVGGKNVPGSMTFAMAPGEYRVSSAMVQKTGDQIERFASHEAHFRVIPGDNVSILLTLKALETPETHQSYAQLHGVTGDVAGLLGRPSNSY